MSIDPLAWPHEPHNLNALADIFDSLADTARRRIAQAEYDRRQQAAAEQIATRRKLTQDDDTATLILRIQELRDQGMSAAASYQEATKGTQFSAEFAVWIMGQDQRRRRAQHAVIIDYFAEAGWTDRAIAKILELHPVSVARNRSKRRKKRYSAEQLSLFPTG
jgi:hypothetical protein